MMRKVLVLFCLFVFTLCSLLAESWFVCLGSFTVEENAKRFVDVLKDKGFSASIDRREIRGTLYHRVLLLVDFEDVEDAREKRDVLLGNEGIVALKLKDLWVCVPSDEFYQEYQNDRVSHHLMEKPIVLKENVELPTSNEKPYSVLVGKYKEESVAENNKDRLKKDGFDAYVVKTYDDREYFSFDVNVSAFETEEEAEKLLVELQEKGIHTDGIVNYKDVEESIAKYNALVKTKDVGKFLGKAEIPTVFSLDVQDTIREFPINKDFQIESIHIFDLENIRKCGKYEGDTQDIDRVLINGDATSVASIAHYKDNLFNKNITILLQKGDKGAYRVERKEGDSSLTLRTAKGEMKCILREEDDSLHLLGANEDGDTFVKMMSESFSKEEFDVFLNNVSNDSSLLVYPEIRKSLLVLPKENEDCKRDFLSFSLEKVDASYARDKGYAKWAMPIVGHWQSRGLFNVNDENVSVSFFDMDYDYNASSVHGMFMDAHRESIINEENKPIALKRLEGWFVVGRSSQGGEVSFSVKSYIVAVDAYNSGFDTRELVRLGDDLQIWE